VFLVVVGERLVFVLGQQGSPSVIDREATEEISRQYTGVEYGQDGIALRCHHVIAHKHDMMGAVVEHNRERWVQCVWYQVCPHVSLFEGRGTWVGPGGVWRPSAEPSTLHF
jgi:hypothetical protein